MAILIPTLKKSIPKRAYLFNVSPVSPLIETDCLRDCILFFWMGLGSFFECIFNKRKSLVFQGFFLTVQTCKLLILTLQLSVKKFGILLSMADWEERNPY